MMRKLTIPVLVSIAILALPGRVPSLIERPGGPEAAGVTMTLPLDYVLLSPLSRSLDALTLLSTVQTIALIVSVAIFIIAWNKARKASWKRIAISLAVWLLTLGTLEAAAAFLPRAMASLTVDDPEIVRVDFHSHTAASHDVRKSVSAEDNRKWHRAGGFDIAYVTDHVRFDGVEQATKRNPALAGDGVSLVTGMEGRYHRIMSTVVLGITSADSGVLNRRGNILSEDLKSPRAPVTIIAIPNRNLDSLSTRVRDSIVALPNLAGIELVDAAPRGLGQLDRDEGRIRNLASDLRLALVAGSNNHGYGRTVAAWNLMRVPGWRSMTPDSAAAAVESQLRSNRESVRIVHRNRVTTHDFRLAFIALDIVLRAVGGLGLSERLTWIAWIWLAAGAVALSSKRRHAMR